MSFASVRALASAAAAPAFPPVAGEPPGVSPFPVECSEDGVGSPVGEPEGSESVLASSDLYEREGKNPQAFCTDIDKEGDVRILCNLKNNEGWMETILHELGHHHGLDEDDLRELGYG